MAKKINPMVAIVGGLFAVLFIFAIIAVVLYPPGPTGGHDDGHAAPHDNGGHAADSHADDTHADDTHADDAHITDGDDNHSEPRTDDKSHAETGDDNTHVTDGHEE